MGINITKRLEEEHKEKEKQRQANYEEKTIQEAHKFVNDYVIKQLLKLRDDEITASDIDNAVDFVLLLSQFSEEDTKSGIFLKFEELDFLHSKDKKIKESVALRISKWLVYKTIDEES